MAGQLSTYGAQYLANTIGGVVPPVIGTTAPWSTDEDAIPGQIWIDTTSGAIAKYWNKVAWVAGPEPLYLAALTGDPSVSGPDGGYAQNISDLIEDTTSGYARQSVAFSAATGYPAQLVNSDAVIFGPYSAAQSLPVQWAAIVSAASGDDGHVFYFWTLPVPQQVNVSQSISVGAGSIVWSES